MSKKKSDDLCGERLLVIASSMAGHAKRANNYLSIANADAYSDEISIKIGDIEVAIEEDDFEFYDEVCLTASRHAAYEASLLDTLAQNFLKEVSEKNKKEVENA